MGSLAGNKFLISYNDSTSKFDISVIDFFGAQTDKISNFLNESFFTPQSDVILLASGELDFPTETTDEKYKIKFVGNVSKSSLGISFVSSAMQPLQGYDLAIDYLAYQKMCLLLGYFQVVSTIATVDLTQVNTKLDNIKSKIDTNLNKKSSDILTKVTAINTKVNSNLDSKISDISIDLTPLQASINNLKGFDFSGSLNGASGSYPDDTKVSIEGYVGEYIVSSSNVMKYDDNLHIIIYRCKKDDKYFNVPSNMVSLYVAPTP